MPILVIDNGSDRIAASYDGKALPQLPNAAIHSVGVPSLRRRGIAEEEDEGGVDDPSSSAGGVYDSVGLDLLTLATVIGASARLVRPLDQNSGMLVDADLQALLWRQVLRLAGVPEDGSVGIDHLVVTVPYGSPWQPASSSSSSSGQSSGAASAVANEWSRLLTRHFRFKSVIFVSPAWLALVGSAALAHGTGGGSEKTRKPTGSEKKPLGKGGKAPEFTNGPQLATGVVVDAGASSTVVAAFVGGRRLSPGAVLRLDIGGRQMTRALAEHITFTQMGLAEEEWLVNAMRERVCFVAPDWTAAMLALRSDAPAEKGDPLGGNGGHASPAASFEGEVEVFDNIAILPTSLGGPAPDVRRASTNDPAFAAIVHYALPSPKQPLGQIVCSKVFKQCRPVSTLPWEDDDEVECDEGDADAGNGGVPTIKFGPVRFALMESLFQPALLPTAFLHRDACGLTVATRLVVASATNAAIEQFHSERDAVRRKLLGNVILCGGVAQCPGLLLRFRAELTTISPVVETLIEPGSSEYENGSAFPDVKLLRGRSHAASDVLQKALTGIGDSTEAASSPEHPARKRNRTVAQNTSDSPLITCVTAVCARQYVRLRPQHSAGHAGPPLVVEKSLPLTERILAAFRTLP